MRRLVLLAVPILAASAFAVQAGMPRGAELSADEQTADEQTGETRATGNAELVIKEFGILGRASSILLQPKLNAITFRGQARLAVGQERFEGEAVRCTLDFDRCAVEPDVTAEQVQVGASAAANP